MLYQYPVSIRLLVISFLILITKVNGWMFPELSRPLTRGRLACNAKLQLTSDDNDEIPQSNSYNDPCWGTMLDDDCSMGNIYASNFVASKWIQSMPCGAGIQDCDMPPELTTPDTRTEAGIENVDVMEFLGLKRASSIETPDPKNP